MILNKNGKNRGSYNNFCTKLLKNLGHYSENPKSFIRSHYHCNILYNWIYNSKKKHTIPDEFINDCFEEYIRIGKAMDYKYSCSYDIHNRLYEEPMNMTILNIFESNMETIRHTLNDEKGVINFPCRKFVCKCVHIYKNMHENYCKNIDDGNKENTGTCSKLTEFYSTYRFFFLDNIVKKDEIPALDDDPNIYSNKCQIYLQEQASDTTAVSQDLPTSLTRTLPKGENQSSPMFSTVPTALGTVAGASSILALLYKVTIIFT
ncbi:hypothetical protein PVIIG_05209 [Plasmodium vivax India VII]|uniref:Uncharacterized protein n=1 Tax=Plasmodium vivax India VII TaxID=1077284 RepID=A0A0J9S393_PLAVI|nr:hypothetical protein PVIIG_05209 [Plasmodium vivax India VII]